MSNEISCTKNLLVIAFVAGRLPQVLLVYTEDGNLSADTCRCRETVKCAMRESNKFQKVLVLLYLHFGVALSFGKYFAWKMSAKSHKKIVAVPNV